MPPVPFAAFLVGSLLTVLLPIGLLVALATWYWAFSARVPETDGGMTPITDPAAAQPGPDVSAELPPDPAEVPPDPVEVPPDPVERPPGPAA